MRTGTITLDMAASEAKADPGKTDKLGGPCGLGSLSHIS